MHQCHQAHNLTKHSFRLLLQKTIENSLSFYDKKYIDKLVNEDLSNEINSIKIPTLLIWGDKDTATPIEHAKIMNEKISNSGLVVYEGSSHFSFIENKNKTVLIFKSFLDIK